MSKSKLKILFSGMVAGDPHQGGATWAVLQYVLGLRELGHEVMLVEPVQQTAICPAGTAFEGSASAAYFNEVMAEFGLTQNSALLLEGTRETVGLSYDGIADFARQADLLINVSGMLTDRELSAAVPTRAYLDLDPAFIQIWHAVERIDMRFKTHTHFISVGLALGSPECPVPTCGKRWITTTQPVVLSQWPVGGEIKHNAFTTVGNWRGYGSVSFKGEFFGQKAHSVRELIELPRCTEESFLLAMAIHPDETRDLESLRSAGWRLVDSKKVASNPRDYRQFVSESKAEIGIAKSGYVKSRCGWFSDRSACYLAAGRPVAAQDTGFSRYLPVGEGLLAFTSVEEAAAAVECVNEDYARHSRAARMLAEEHFSSAIVLPRLLELLGYSS